MIAEPPVGENHTPHDLGQCDLLSQVILGRNQSSELEVIQRFGPFRFSKPQQLDRSAVIQSEMIHEIALDVALFFSSELPIGVSQLEQQGARGQLDRIGLSRT